MGGKGIYREKQRKSTAEASNGKPALTAPALPFVFCYKIQVPSRSTYSPAALDRMISCRGLLLSAARGTIL